MSASKRVVLFFPSYASEEISPPLALIAISGPLLSAGFEVEIIDSALHPDFIQRTLDALDGALCLGVSLITGPMIADTIAVCRAAKARYPDLPIILGGWHPSILPEQTLEADFVDSVVLRQGELAMLDIVTRLSEGDTVHGVKGTLSKPGGTVTRHADRPYTPVVDLPKRMPGYERIDYDAYERATGLRWVMYTTSHGCPYNCSYCSNASVYGRKLDELPVEQVLDEVTWLVKKYDIRLLGIIDDIFFASRKRSLAIAEGFLSRNLNIQWYIQDRADSIAKLSIDQAKMLRRSGLVRVHFGAESGSDKVLESIDKLSRVSRTLEAVERCRDADIRASFGFIFGLPDEDEDDMLQTVDLIRNIYKLYARADCHTNIFTPYPGSPLWPRSVDMGVAPPTSLEEWVAFFPRLTELPWLHGERHQRLQDIRQYLRLGYPNVRVGEDQGSRRHRLALRLLGPSSRWRIENHRYRTPVEVRGYDAFQKLKERL
ncbi:MAG: anaerobic magnesium-protoporphyrin IX monomethyl ester cyclase [Myxococcota bacterium]|jgi:anaerobic magnesium-protoporphyrin IX monomethyl ester cyclase